MTGAVATIEIIRRGEAVVEMQADNGHWAISLIGNPSFCGSLYELGYTHASVWARAHNYRLERYSRV